MQIKSNSPWVAFPLVIFLLGIPGCSGGSCGCTPSPTTSVSGRLSTTLGLPLEGVEVMAESASANGFEAHTRTDAEGRYTLAVHAGTYRILSQPQTATATYLPQASALINVANSSIPLTGVDLRFQPALSGSVHGSVSPAMTASQSDMAILRTVLVVDGAPQSFIIRTATPVLENSAEHFTFGNLPEGTYTVAINRSDKNLTVFLVAPEVAAVVIGGSATELTLEIKNP